MGRTSTNLLLVFLVGCAGDQTCNPWISCPVFLPLGTLTLFCNISFHTFISQSPVSHSTACLQLPWNDQHTIMQGSLAIFILEIER